MTAVNINSTRVANAVAAQPVMSPKGSEDRPEVVKDYIALGTANLAAGSVWYLCEVPWDAQIHSFKLYNDQLDSNGSPTLTISVGVRQVDATGTFSTLSQDACYYATTAFGSAASNTTGTQVAFSAKGSAKVGQKVYADGGLTGPADGKRAVLVAVVGTGAATAVAGNVGFVVDYTV